MDADRWRQISRLYHEALERPSDQRDAFLDAHCHNDEVLRREVVSLLASEASAESFLAEPAAEVANAALTQNSEHAQTGLEPGSTLGTYRIERPLGRGGMGVVFLAHDATLHRKVALKVLGALTNDETARARLVREARGAAALNHPNICTVYEVGQVDGRSFIAMEYVEGRTVSDLLAESTLRVEQAVRYGIEAADALAYAHDHGVVHRDLKAANAIVTTTGRLKLIDFGLARREDVLLVDATTMASIAPQGVAVGTPYAMAPEQIRGGVTDARTDIWALGVLLYEMLSGARPFAAPTAPELFSAILRDAPAPLPDATTVALRLVIEQCLEKEPDRRYKSAHDIRGALEAIHAGSGLPRAVPRAAEDIKQALDSGEAVQPTRWLRWIGVSMLALVRAALVLLLAAGAVGTWFWFRAADVRWADRVARPEITRLTEAGDLYEAYRLARQAQTYIPEDAELKKMVDRITLPISVVTEPAGADVHVKGYMTPDAGWEVLGQTPLQGIRIPYALMRWRISKTGFEAFEGAPMGTGPFTALATGLRLDPEGTRPPGMVRVPGGAFARPEFPAVSLEDFWLDRHEVTNRQFKAFVDASGYDARQYWSERFLDAQRELPWDEAMTRFKDPTGRPGPSTWELGTFAAGRENHPVGGVSWYEAAAYCRFAGGSLPTVYHWYTATAQDQFSDILRVSNFGSDGPTEVENRPGLGDYGTYDMAGNVKEWTWNATGDRRYILGGAWSEPTYMFRLDPDARLPFERLATHGFRCARFPEPIEEQLLDPIRAQPQGVAKPVGDDVFNAYQRMYVYDQTELAAKVEGVDEGSPFWRRETVSFNAAYRDERVVAQLFLPRDVAPPYQAVVWFPGNDAFFSSSSQSPASAYLFDFIPRSGRALIYPVYNGMYERRRAFSRTGSEWRDMVIMWSKDLGRTLDYLQTRQDMDRGKLAYYGFSLGSFGPIFTAVDGRFHASVLLAGGLKHEAAPEIDVINFASRSRTPTLMINGRDDFINPGDSSQLPLFRLLGAPALDKRHAVLDGGHIPSDRREIIREVLAWLDRYLGPVTSKPAVPRGSR